MDNTYNYQEYNTKRMAVEQILRDLNTASIKLKSYLSANASSQRVVTKYINKYNDQMMQTKPVNKWQIILSWTISLMFIILLSLPGLIKIGALFGVALTSLYATYKTIQYQKWNSNRKNLRKYQVLLKNLVDDANYVNEYVKMIGEEKNFFYQQGEKYLAVSKDMELLDYFYTSIKAIKDEVDGISITYDNPTYTEPDAKAENYRVVSSRKKGHGKVLNIPPLKYLDN